MNSIEKEMLLRDIYFSPKLGYRSKEDLYQQAIKQDSSITRKEVQHFLETQKEYTQFKKYHHPRRFRKTFVRDLGEQCQVDLITWAQKHEKENDGKKYIFVAIEILSRFAFAYPLSRKDGKSVAIVMQRFLDDFYKKI